jgi:TonB family protein
MFKRFSLSYMLVAALCQPFVAPAIRAEDAIQLAARLHAADAGSALDTPNLKPWHLKLSVQLFDDKGKPKDQGTIEEWWSAPGVERREYKTGTYSATEIRKDGQLYRTKGAETPSYYLDYLREQAVHPMPTSSEVDQSTPELRKQSFGKAPLECVMLSQPIKRVMVLPLGLFPTYCFDPGKDVLRLTFEFGLQATIRNSLATFQGRTVARDVTVMADKAEAASSHIETLEGGSIPERELDVSDATLAQSPEMVRISSGVVAGNALTQVQPVYPASAKQNRVSGTVVMHAIIGTDGRVHSLKLVSTPDPDLAISAIWAVRKWTYKPYILNGVPTDVETTINVNYTFGP